MGQFDEHVDYGDTGGPSMHEEARATAGLLTQLDSIAGYLRANASPASAAWVDRAADHIEFLETQLQYDTIDAVDWDDRKRIREVFQAATVGRVTIEGPMAAEYDGLLAVARWGATQAFKLMTDSARGRDER